MCHGQTGLLWLIGSWFPERSKLSGGVGLIAATQWIQATSLRGEAGA